MALMDWAAPYEPDAPSWYQVTPPDPSWPKDEQDDWLAVFNRASLPAITIHEVAPGHYPWMVALHTALLISCPLEVWFLRRPFVPLLAGSMLFLDTRSLERRLLPLPQGAEVLVEGQDGHVGVRVPDRRDRVVGRGVVDEDDGGLVPGEAGQQVVAAVAADDDDRDVTA